jgi:hypothetical protein
MKKITSNIKEIISKSYARRSYQNWVYRSSPFKLSRRQLDLGTELSPSRLKFWRKRYLDGRDAGKVLLVHLGLDRLRHAFYRNDIESCFRILDEMKDEQRRLGIYLIEIEQIEDQILDLQRRVNSRLRFPDKTSAFGSILLKAIGVKSIP